MITLLPIPRIVAIVAVVYALLFAICVLVASLVLGVAPDWRVLRWAAAGATPLQFALMVWVWHGWRMVWQAFPVLNRLLFPDLNGRWDMSIHFQRGGVSDVVKAEAVIRQDFLRLSMEVSSPGSDSQTLSATPKRHPESGRPELHYIYLVTPHALGMKASTPYWGAAILKLSAIGPLGLRGNYWTSAQTVGHFDLEPINPP